MIEGEPTEFSADLALLRDGAERWPNAQGLRLRERLGRLDTGTLNDREPPACLDPGKPTKVLKRFEDWPAHRRPQANSPQGRRRSSGRAGSNQGRLCPVFAGMTTI